MVSVPAVVTGTKRVRRSFQGDGKPRRMDKEQPKILYSVTGEICLPVRANGPGEAALLFKSRLGAAFRDCETADRIYVIDERDDRLRVVDLEAGHWHFAEDDLD